MNRDRKSNDENAYTEDVLCQGKPALDIVASYADFGVSAALFRSKTEKETEFREEKYRFAAETQRFT